MRACTMRRAEQLRKRTVARCNIVSHIVRPTSYPEPQVSRHRHAWVTVLAVARRLNVSRWEVLMLALHGELKYRPIANGIEVRDDSVHAYQDRIAAA